MWRNEWNRISKSQLLGFGFGIGIFLVVLLASEPGFIFLLDHANLLFHEAGHPLIGFLSGTLEPYGGTIGQLAFPIIIAASCWRKGQVLGFAASSIWFFENWLNIARYMADARKLQLPLVGGGDPVLSAMGGPERPVGHPRDPDAQAPDHVLEDTGGRGREGPVGRPADLVAALEEIGRAHV